jgi:acyl dehydratase
VKLDAATIIAIGGYTHPLFTDDAYLATTPFAARPVPGQGLLLVMGGLAEQSGFERVDFLAPAVDGDDVRVEIEPLEPESARVTRWTWRCVRADGAVLAEAVARFLVRAQRNPGAEEPVPG